MLLRLYVWATNNIKKILILLIAYGLIASLFVVFMKKDNAHVNVEQQRRAHSKALIQMVNDKELNKTEQGKQFLTLYKGLLCSSVGEACTNDPADADKYFSQSLFGKAAGMMMMPYLNPPSSGLAWTYGELQDAGFAPKTYAAGIGFQSIMGFNTIWKGFRNIVYMGMVLAIVTLGFLIMFRVKIDPQTVVSVENALPRIVITLLLVTFSFAIAGFLIDLTYLVTLMVFQVFDASGVPGFESNTLQDEWLNRVDGWTMMASFDDSFNTYHKGMQHLYYAMPGMIQATIQTLSTAILAWIGYKIYQAVNKVGKDMTAEASVNGGIVIAGASFNISTFFWAIVGIFMGFAVAPAIYFFLSILIVLIGLLALYFRIFFLLIGAYIQIVLQLIFAPVLILPTVLPGNNSFLNWLKRLFGFLMVFPLTTFFLILSRFVLVLNAANSPVDPTGIINYDNPYPPFTLPLMEGLDTTSMGAVIGAVILVMTPSLVKSAVKPLIGDGAGIGAGALFAGAGSTLSTAVAKVSTFATVAPHLREAKGIGGIVKKISDVTGIGGK